MESLEKILSTHPLSEERISYFKTYIDENETGKDFTPILTDHEWQALKKTCEANPDIEAD
jgi:predicted Zn-dependent protease